MSCIRAINSLSVLQSSFAEAYEAPTKAIFMPFFSIIFGVQASSRFIPVPILVIPISLSNFSVVLSHDSP